TRTMKRLAIAALAIGLAACNSDSTSPTVSIVGSYSLQKINGFNLPFTFSDGVTVTSDVLRLNQDGSYSETEQDSDGFIVQDIGFYSNINGSITFTDQTSGKTFLGSLSGSVLTVIVGGNTEAFQHN
ncbi:MAG TPA: hypothetical protein VII52_16220, partial [Gemmatimonadaceae bacterium]